MVQHWRHRWSSSLHYVQHFTKPPSWKNLNPYIACISPYSISVGKIWDVLQMPSTCGKPNNKLFSGLHKPSWVHTTWTDLKRYELYDKALHSLRPWKQVLQRRLFTFEVGRLSRATRTEDDDMGRGSKLKSISVLTCMKSIQLYFLMFILIWWYG